MGKEKNITLSQIQKLTISLIEILMQSKHNKLITSPVKVILIIQTNIEKPQ